MSGSSPKRELGAEHNVDKPLPRSSPRPRGLVMALEDGARVGGGNNGRGILLKGGRELLYLLEEIEIERTEDHLAHKLALEYGVLNA
jgi:hypothetical protein